MDLEIFACFKLWTMFEKKCIKSPYPTFVLQRIPQQLLTSSFQLGSRTDQRKSHNSHTERRPKFARIQLSDQDLCNPLVPIMIQMSPVARGNHRDFRAPKSLPKLNTAEPVAARVVFRTKACLDSTLMIWLVVIFLVLLRSFTTGASLGGNFLPPSSSCQVKTDNNCCSEGV